LLATIVRDGLNTRLWLVTADGSRLTDLGSLTSDIQHNPVWSPQGDRLTFTVHHSEGMKLSRNIWVVNADGTQAVNLTSDVGFLNESPSWSPDGRQIVFASYPADDSQFGYDVNGDIWIMNADGTDLKNLTQD
jgi:TolB protein